MFSPTCGRARNLTPALSLERRGSRTGAAGVGALVGMCLLMSSAVFVQPQPAAAAVPVAFTASVDPNPAHPGEVVTATVHAVIEPGWHVYATATGGASPSAIVSLGTLAPLGSTAEDKPVRAHDSNFNVDVAYHVGRATFTRPFRAPAALNAPLALVFHYQTCNDRICLPPTDMSMPVDLGVTPGPVRAAYAAVRPPPSGAPETSSMALFLLEAIAAGLLSLITPCVFPLIPISLASFAKQANGDRGKLVRLALGFAGGIIGLYVLVGVLAATTTGIAVAATNPWVNLFEFALFVVFALSFFETITLQLPASLAGFQSTAQRQGGVWGLMLMGVAFVLASFTCTAPFIGTLLVASSGGERLRPLLGTFTFGLAFTSPFLVCAAFPQWIGRIPKGGVWLARVKATLGFVELAAATKFLSNADQVWQWKLLTGPVLLAIWAMVFFCAFLYLTDLLRFGVVAETEPAGKRIPAGRGAFAAVFLAATIYCFWGIAGRPISPLVAAFLPPAGYGSTLAADPNLLPWPADYHAALIEARAENRPLVIDFTGYTCTNCRYNEDRVFPRPEIQQALAGFVRVKLYTDGGPDAKENEALEVNKFKDAALPLYGVIDPSSEAVVASIAGVVSPQTFADFLRQAQARFTPAATVAAAPAPTKPGPWGPLDTAAIGHGTPTLVDFTAAWCTNCKAIERNVFEDKSVQPILSRDFVTMRVDMTQWDSPASQTLRTRYHIDALPAVLIFDASGHELAASRITGQLRVADFLKRIADIRPRNL